MNFSLRMKPFSEVVGNGSRETSSNLSYTRHTLPRSFYFRFLETHKEWFTEDQYKNDIKEECIEDEGRDIEMHEVSTTAVDSSWPLIKRSTRFKPRI